MPVTGKISRKPSIYTIIFSDLKKIVSINGIHSEAFGFWILKESMNITQTTMCQRLYGQIAYRMAHGLITLCLFIHMILIIIIRNGCFKNGIQLHQTGVMIIE